MTPPSPPRLPPTTSVSLDQLLTAHYSHRRLLKLSLPASAALSGPPPAHLQAVLPARSTPSRRQPLRSTRVNLVSPQCGQNSRNGRSKSASEGRRGRTACFVAEGHFDDGEARQIEGREGAGSLETGSGIEAVSMGKDSSGTDSSPPAPPTPLAVRNDPQLHHVLLPPPRHPNPHLLPRPPRPQTRRDPHHPLRRSQQGRRSLWDACCRSKRWSGIESAARAG